MRLHFEVYVHSGYEPARISSVSFLVNGQPVDALGLLVHHTKAREVVRPLHCALLFNRKMLWSPFGAPTERGYVVRWVRSLCEVDVQCGVRLGIHLVQCFDFCRFFSFHDQ